MRKLGVIVPIYNVERYLGRCIESILTQTYHDIEIILVDDGSTDGSGNMCDYYAKADCRVKVIHQENTGSIMARYNGMINSSCEYITFVDGDDWIEPFTYQRMSVYMENDEDLIIFQIVRYFDEINSVCSRSNYLPGRYDRDAIKKYIFPDMIWNIKKLGFGLDPSLCNKIIKRDKLIREFERVKNLHIHYGEDVAVIYPLVLNINSLVITDQYLYYHRQRKNGEIAAYIKDDEFYKKLFILYDYLKKNIGINMEFSKQIDYFYLCSVELRLRIYGDRKSRKGYIFPFDIIPAKSKIIIYGAAEIGQLFYDQVQRLDYCTVVAWVDKNYLAYQDNGVKKIDVIKNNYKYDYIVVAIGQQSVAKQAIISLKNMGIEEEKIIWSIK